MHPLAVRGHLNRHSLRRDTLLALLVGTAAAARLLAANSSHEPAYGSPSPAASDRSTSVSVEDHQVVGQVGGNAVALAVRGHYGYLSTAARVVALDVADPDGPRAVGESALLAGTLGRLAVAGDYLYVISTGRLYTLSIADPTTPRLVGELALPDDAQEILIAEVHAYLALGASGIGVLDLSQPDVPRIVSALDTPGFAGDVAVRNGFAYLADRSDGLLVIDVRQPDQPRLAGSIAIQSPSVSGESGAIAVTMWDSYACVLDAAGSVHLIDVRDPARPSELDKVVPRALTDLGVGRDLALVNGWLWVVSTTKLYLMEPVGRVSQRNLSAINVTQGGIATDNGALFLVDRDGMQLVGTDASDRIALGKRYDLPQPRDAYQVHRVGRDLYVAEGNRSVWVADTAEPTRPRSIAQIDALADATDWTAAGDIVYKYTSGQGVTIWDAHDPLHPLQTGNAQLAEYCRYCDMRLSVAGDLALVVQGDLGVAILDVRDRANPAYAARVTPLYTMTDVVATEFDARDAEVLREARQASVWDGECQAAVWADSRQSEVRHGQAHVPLRPLIPDKMIGGATAAVAEGARLYVAENYEYLPGTPGTKGSFLRVFDVTDTAHPQALATVPISGSVEAIALSGRYLLAADRAAYLADRSRGPGLIRVFDLAPSAPIEVARVEVPEAARVAVNGRWGYVWSDANQPLRILDLADPAHPALAQTLELPGQVTDLAFDSVDGVKADRVNNDKGDLDGRHVYVAARNAGLFVVALPVPPSTATPPPPPSATPPPGKPSATPIVLESHSGSNYLPLLQNALLDGGVTHQ